MNFNVLSLIQLDFICTDPVKRNVWLPTWMWPESKVSQSGEDFISL